MALSVLVISSQTPEMVGLYKFKEGTFGTTRKHHRMKAYMGTGKNLHALQI